MGLLEISLMVVAGVLGAVFGYDAGRRNGIQELSELQEYERSKQIWEESMQNLQRRYSDED